MKIKICIVMSVYNDDITNKLFFSAKKELIKFGIKRIEKFEVPGSFEIPVAISKLAKKYDAFIAIGCIIQGQTLNFALISESITNGIMQISVKENKPIGNAILTCFNKKQAKERFNKGAEAAKAVIAVLKNEPKKI